MDDKVFIDRARNSLDRRLAQTPAHIRSRLNAARHHALDSRRRGTRRAWMGAVATAAMLALVVGMPWLKPSPDSGAPVVAGMVPQAGDFEMLMQRDELALYEDMDFYLWLDEQALNVG